MIETPRLEFDRPLAFPMYLYWTNDEVPRWEPQEPDAHGNRWAGRVILWGQAMNWVRDKEHETDDRRNMGPAIPIPETAVDNICDTDVVYIPYFWGIDHGMTERPECGRGFDHRWGDEITGPNTEVLKTVAPRCKAILLGNLFSEMAFADYYSPRNHTDFEVWQTELRARRFMVAAATMVREAGGTPAFAPVPYEIECDQSVGNCTLRNYFIELGALFITFNGGDLMRGLDNKIRDAYPEEWEAKKGYPYQQWLDYFSPLDCISGVSFKAGLAAGNDQLLADHGVKAGTVGWK